MERKGKQQVFSSVVNSPDRFVSADEFRILARVGAELFVEAREVRGALDFAGFPEKEGKRVEEAFTGITRIKNAEFAETTGVDEAIARRGGFRALVDVAEAVILNGIESGFEAA